MDAWDEWKDRDEDEDELEDEDAYNSGKDALMICIEVSQRLLAPTHSNGDSTFILTLSTILDLMKRKVIISRKDLVGIVLFNTEARQGTQADEHTKANDHIYVLHELSQVSAEGIQKLKHILADAKKDPEAIVEKYKAQAEGSSNQLADAIRICGTIMKDKAGTAACRVFLITDNDDPFPKDVSASRQLRDVTRTNVNDMREMKTDIIPFFISRVKEDQIFDVDKFYKELFSWIGLDLEDPAVLSTVMLEESDNMYDDLKAQSRIGQSQKRAQFTIPFVLGEGLEIGIQGFSFITETKKGAAINVDTSGRDVREVKSIVTYDDSDQARPLNPQTEIKPYYGMGGQGSGSKEKVVFSNDEIKALKTLGLSPGLYLLGFTQLEHFKPEEQIKHSYFIYPYEEAVRSVSKSFPGSRRVFTSLLLTLLEKDKIGFGVLLPRTNSTPVHVLIVPQAEMTENNDPQGKQLEPPGFHLLQLCFADDLRSLDLKSTIPCATDDDPESIGNQALTQIKRVLQKIKQRFNPDNYPNPKLNYHYDCLQAVALKEDLPEVNDSTLPLYHAIKERTGDSVIAFKALVADHPSKSDNKHQGTASTGGAKKRRRVEDDEDAETYEDKIIEHFQSGKSQKLVIPELKAFLKSKQQSTGGKKADLIARAKQVLAADGKVEANSDSD